MHLQHEVQHLQLVPTTASVQHWTDAVGSCQRAAAMCADLATLTTYRQAYHPRMQHSCVLTHNIMTPFNFISPVSSKANWPCFSRHRPHSDTIHVCWGLLPTADKEWDSPGKDQASPILCKSLPSLDYASPVFLWSAPLLKYSWVE